jgi:isoleucyl-tRNA synthetase
VTEELEVEGRARDLIRLVQQARRDADLHVSDRIALTIMAAPAWLNAVAQHEGLIAAETLATSVATVTDDDLAEPEIAVIKAIAPST